MTDWAIKIDKRLLYFLGGRAGGYQIRSVGDPVFSGAAGRESDMEPFRRRTALFFLARLPGALNNVTHDNHQPVPLLFKIF